MPAAGDLWPEKNCTPGWSAVIRIIYFLLKAQDAEYP